MKRIRHLFAIALLACSGGAVASDSTLQVVISVTITTVNEIEWASGTAQADKDGNRTWTIAAATLATAYTSTVDGTMTQSVNGAVPSRTLGLDIKNKSVTPISLSITATSTVWTLVAVPAAVNQYKLEPSINDAVGYLAALIDAAAAVTLVNPVAGSATQTFDLQLTTPTTVSGAAAGTCTVTITSTLL